MNRLSAKPQLVVADDSAAMRQLVRDAFAGLAMDVDEAVDGRQLYWTLERCCASSDTQEVIVIADVCMPVYSGLDVLEALGGVRWPFAFIIITSNPDAETRSRVSRYGAILLQKPFTIADLRYAVGSIGA
jgi:FixJ family two-component response regulator